MEKIKVMSVFGTRPEAIKMAPLVLEMKKYPELEPIVCLTAQHREMLDSVMEAFHISADYDLNIMEKSQTLYTITTKALNGLKSVIEEAKPDIILVHGDTTTSFVVALAAFYSQVKVGHVEAGLRTYDKYSPFPEEMNRRLTGQIADLHFAPTAQNAKNLEHEGIKNGVFITGNTVIDAMKYTVNAENKFTSAELNNIDFAGKRVITMTCHRRENYGEPMENIMRAVGRIAKDYKDTIVVYPVHLSPTVRECAKRNLGSIENVHLIEPLDTVDMHNLMSKSYMVMTDSGGLQEEAPALGKPVLVLRKETERPEAVCAGTVKLAGVEEEKIYSMAAQLLDDAAEYGKMARAVNPYGDGNASERICRAILWSFGRSQEKPENFCPSDQS